MVGGRVKTTPTFPLLTGTGLTVFFTEAGIGEESQKCSCGELAAAVVSLLEGKGGHCEDDNDRGVGIEKGESSSSPLVFALSSRNSNASEDTS
jgi:hypothetical protein